jgi:hypothetical protein
MRIILAQRFRIGSCKRLKTLHIGACENTSQIRIGFLAWSRENSWQKEIAQGCWASRPL